MDILAHIEDNEDNDTNTPRSYRDLFKEVQDMDIDNTPSVLQELYGSKHNPENDLFQSRHILDELDGQMDQHYEEYIQEKNQSERRDTIEDIEGVHQIYDQLNDVDEDEEKEVKNGTATFKNLRQYYMEDGEGEDKQEEYYLSGQKNDNKKQKEHFQTDNQFSSPSIDEPAERSSTETHDFEMQRNRGFSISDITNSGARKLVPGEGDKRQSSYDITTIPKINMDKILNSKVLKNNISSQDFNGRINETEGYDANLEDHEIRDKGESEAFSVARSLEINSYRAFMNKNKPTGSNTYRNSENSWLFNKSKNDIDEEESQQVYHNYDHSHTNELSLDPRLIQTMKTQDMIKDLLDLDSEILRTEPENNGMNELKDQIKGTKDKIYRIVEDYKEQVISMSGEVESLESKILALDKSQENLEFIKSDFQLHSYNVEQKVASEDPTVKMVAIDLIKQKSEEIRNMCDTVDAPENNNVALGSTMLSNQSYSETVPRFSGSNLRSQYQINFNSISDQLMDKINMSVNEYNQLKRKYNDVQFEIQKLNKRILNLASELSCVYSNTYDSPELSDQVTKSSEVQTILNDIDRSDIFSINSDKTGILQSELNELIQKQK